MVNLLIKRMSPTFILACRVRTVTTFPTTKMPKITINLTAGIAIATGFALTHVPQPDPHVFGYVAMIKLARHAHTFVTQVKAVAAVYPIVFLCVSVVFVAERVRRTWDDDGFDALVGCIDGYVSRQIVDSLHLAVASEA